MKSLIRDFGEAIDQVEGGGYRGYFVDDRVLEPNGLQSLEGLRKQKGSLIKLFSDAQKAIRKCIDDPKNGNPMRNDPEKGCRLTNNDIPKALHLSISAKKITASDDLEIRATSPLAANAVSLAEIDGWKNFIQQDGMFRNFAACSIASAIIRSNIDKTANLRCQQDNECLQESDLKVYRDYAYRGLIVKPEQCKTAEIKYPAVTQPTGKNLGVIPIPAGKTFKIKTGSDAGEPNSWELRLVCPGNQIASWPGLKHGSLQEISFPRMSMNCNLEIRAFTPGGGYDTICDRPREPDVDPKTYLAIPQLVNVDDDGDMVVGQKIAHYRLRFDDYLQVDRDCNDLSFEISVGDQLK